ncbi:unnamed protein product [Musa hybrid cultivar]
MFPAVGWASGILHPASWWWSNSKAVSPRWRSPPFCQGFKITSLAISDLQKSEEIEARARQSQNGYVDFQISAEESTEHVECVDPGARFLLHPSSVE